MIIDMARLIKNVYYKYYIDEFLTSMNASLEERNRVTAIFRFEVSQHLNDAHYLTVCLFLSRSTVF